jgi:hypothetical protein
MGENTPGCLVTDYWNLIPVLIETGKRMASLALLSASDWWLTMKSRFQRYYEFFVPSSMSFPMRDQSCWARP